MMSKMAVTCNLADFISIIMNDMAKFDLLNFGTKIYRDLQQIICRQNVVDINVLDEIINE